MGHGLSNASLTAFHDKYAEMERAQRLYDRMVDDVLADPRLSTASAKFLNRIWYEPGRSDAASLAQRSVREALTKGIMLTMLYHSQTDALARHGPTRLSMISTLPSCGYSPIEKPRLALDRVAAHFERCAQRRHLEGIGLPDFALVHRPRDFEATELGIHYHGVCRALGAADGSISGAASEISSSKKNRHGLPVAQVGVKASPLSSWDVASLTYYISKISCGLKQESGRTTYTQQTHWAPEHAIRALDALSHIAPMEAVRAFGDWGKGLKSECEARAQRFCSRLQSTDCEIDHDWLRRGWARLYRELELDDWQPVRLATLSS